MLTKVTSRLNLLTLSSVLLLLSALAPLNYYSYTYSWTPKNTQTETRIALANPQPTFFSATFSCDGLNNQPEWLFESFGGPAFQISASNTNVLVTLGSRIKQNEITVLDLIFIKVGFNPV